MKPSELCALAIDAARGAGEIVQHHQIEASAAGARREYDEKSGALDLVTVADRESEAYLLKFFETHTPDAGFLGEEGTRRAASGDAPTWVVDPLDGTTNFAHGIPAYAVSIAAVRGAEILAGVVFDPARDELFAATRGAGATINDRPLCVSSVPTLSRALAATGFPYDRRERGDFYLAYWRALMMRTHGVRRFGAAAIDLAWVAAGRLDAFWEFSLNPWDVAAATLLIEEAGGTVTALDGSPLDLFGRRIAASNGALHAELLEVLAAVEAPADLEPPIPDDRVEI